MAELVRTRDDSEVNVIEILSSSIPAPFSNQDRAAIASAHHFPSQPAVTTVAAAEDSPLLSSRDDERESTEIAPEQINAQDVNPSLAYVQHTVLTTLHDLLSTSDPWPSTTTAVSPDRRHSMPSPSSSTATSAAAAAADPLPALLASLRARDPPNTPMTQIAPPDDARAQLAELRARVGVLTPSLHPADAELASALTSLLSVLHRLSSSSSSSPTTPAPSTPAAAQPDEDIYDTLSRQLSGIQTQAEHRPQPRHPVRAVEQALLWSQLDVDLETALRLCRARLPSSSAQQQQQAAELPPPNYSDADLPPQYVEKAGSRTDDNDEKAPPSPTVTLAGTSEKMRLDFEAVTRAIDRLYSAVPQLHDQRAELRPRPPTSNTTTANAKGKAKASSSSSRPPEAELERMLGMLDKASARRLADQTAPLSPAISERASKRVQARHEAFVGRLMDHATTGRMTAQDAVFTERDHAECRDPEAMLSLPEFIREAPPKGMVAGGAAAAGEGERDGEQQQRQQHHGNMKRKSLRALRSRSLSAPSMGWFRDRLSSPSPHVSTHPALSEDEHERGEGDGDGGVERKKKGREGEEEGRIDVAYVAEHHEALRHVLAFVAPPPSSNADLAATFTLDTTASVQEGSLVLRSSTSTTQANGNGTAHRAPRSTSRPSSASSHKSTKSRLTPPPPAPPSPPTTTTTTTLPLPARVLDGRYDLRAQGPHWELKLPVDVVDGDGGGGGGAPLPLLDAEQLRDAAPAGFVCGTCSLPIVRFPPTAAHAHEPNGTITPGRAVRFDDLPSEHWAELVDAWMCHSDQALSASVARTAARGFWPEKGQVLVGGSYVLVGAEVVVRESLWEGGDEVGERKPGEEWRSVRCKCGTYSGRCQDHVDDDEGGGGKTTVYRFAKYAIRPVGATVELPRVPLSAYVVEDMNELALAHATYRFVVLDEEEERPRLLLWLFKPSLKLSYAAPRHYLIPRSGTVHAAKVLYKILGPATAGVEFTTLLNRYPGFPQAEHLMYPKDVCTRLAVLLKESSGCYPENLRTMTGLDVGWLLRA